jgi:NAD(P)-dependent dehydrogenase (short-subunit alcohol dehydrogenase family)
VSINNVGLKTLLPLILDVAQHDSVLAAAEFIKSETENSGLPFVALVNNAGVGRAAPIELQDMDDARHLFDTNVFGAMDLTKGDTMIDTLLSFLLLELTQIYLLL